MEEEVKNPPKQADGVFVCQLFRREDGLVDMSFTSYDRLNGSKPLGDQDLFAILCALANGVNQRCHHLDGGFRKIVNDFCTSVDGTVLEDDSVKKENEELEKRKNYLKEKLFGELGFPQLPIPPNRDYTLEELENALHNFESFNNVRLSPKNQEWIQRRKEEHLKDIEYLRSVEEGLKEDLKNIIIEE